METPSLSKLITKYISLLTVNTSLSISLTLLLVLGVSLHAISSWFKQQKKARGATTLPPGNMGLPIIGETLDFIMAIQRGHPEKFIIDRMNKYSPKVFTTSLLGEKMVVFCGDSGNKCLFSIDKKFVIPWMPPFLKKLLLSPDSARAREGMLKMHKEGRSIVNAFIKSGALQQRFVGIMDYMTRKHIEDKWAPHREVLAYELVKNHTFTLSCRLFTSIEDPKKVAKLEHLFEGITAGMFSIPIDFPGTSLNRAIKYRRLLCTEVLSIIRQRKNDLLDKGSNMETSAQDILSHFLLSEDGEFRNDIDVADLILGIFVAGDTTSTVISYVVKYLAELPHIYAEVLKEQLEIANKKKPGELLNWEDIQQMKYSWSVASEAMRLAPPAQGTFREFIDDFTYDGFTIPKGFKAYWTVHSTNRNPEYFKNPEKFDPSRFQGNGPAPYTFAPFGGGAHMCPGKDFSRTEILVFMHNIVTQFDLEGLMPDEKTIFKAGVVPANGIPIRLHPRNGQSN